jgi:hypothetical protein
MRRHTLLAILVGVGMAAALWPQDAAAVPVFARKYGFQCTMCHSNMPRLNDFGARFRANGYRLPGRENDEKTVLQSPAPVAFRTSAGYTGESFNDAAGLPCTSDFRLNGLDLLSAGVLGSKIGFFMVYVPQIGEARGVAPQDGALEMASVVFSNLAGPWLNLRAGRFEPAFVPFSVKRQLTASPYEIYDYSFPDGPAFSETRSGIEVAGYARQSFSYAAGVVTGSETNHADDTPSDAYARAGYVFGAGEGQTAGQRLGVLGYYGRARPSAGLPDPAPTALRNFYRYGVDASLNAAHLNLAVQYLWSRDDGWLWPVDALALPAGGSPDAVEYSGGFAELSWLPRVDLVGFARFDLVNSPSLDDHDIQRWTAGGRYYAIDNVALHAEYSWRTVQHVAGDDDGTESFVTARIDFAF